MRLGVAGTLAPPALVLVLVLTSPAPARAQSGYDVPRLTPATSSQDNLLSVFSGRTLPSRGYSLGFAFTWTDAPLVVRDPDRLDPGYDPVRGRVLTSQSLLHVVGAYGFFDWLELGFDVPIILDQRADALSGLPQPSAVEETAGVGDIRLVPRFQLLDVGGSGFPVALRVAASLDVALPTGDDARFQGGVFRLTPLAAIELEFPHAVRLIGNLGYTWRESDVDLLDRTIGSDPNVSVGLDVPILRDAGPVDVAVFGEVFHRISTEALGGARLSAWGFALFVGGGGGLNDETGTPDARVFASLGWNRRWGRGPAPSSTGDTEGDGPRGGRSAHGDRDGDGYVDAVDGCPDQPEDRDGFEDADGCPDVDNDGDGITDVFDQCPLEPEDRDGFADADGCPDDDNDGDGLADAEDACPDDPEDPDGDRDEDGCPDLEGDFAIDVVVFFETDQTEVPEESQYELDRLARTLVAAPPWVHVWVEGHADDTGSTEHNQELSKRRALAALNYLVARGVARERLSIVGFGEWYNVRPNQSAGGKRANRRVEFRVAPRASVPKGPPPALTPPDSDPASPQPGVSGSQTGAPS